METQGNVKFTMREFLLPSLDMSAVTELNGAIYEYMLPFVTLVLMGAILWEHFSGTQKTYQDLIIRTISLVLFSLIGHKFLKTGVDYTFSISDYLINRFAQNSEFLVKFAISKENFWQAATTGFGDALLSPVFSIIWLLCWIAVYAVGHIYSLVFKLTFVAIPLSCLISIFPLTKDAVFGVLKSIFWCLITPIVCSIVLISIGSETITSEKMEAKWNSLVQILLYSVTIFYIPGLGTMFLTSQGFQSAGEKLSGMMASSAITLGKYHLLKTASKTFGAGQKYLFNPVANLAGQKAYSFADGKGWTNKNSKNENSLFDKPSLNRFRSGHLNQQEKRNQSARTAQNLSEIKSNSLSTPTSTPLTIPLMRSRINESMNGLNLANSKFNYPNGAIHPTYGKLSNPQQKIPLIENDHKKRISKMWQHISPPQDISDGSSFKKNNNPVNQQSNSLRHGGRHRNSLSGTPRRTIARKHILESNKSKTIHKSSFNETPIK